MKTKHNYELKRRIVQEGKSRVFTEWNKLVPSLTEKEFLENLEWLCADPRENGDGKTGRLTREIGLTSQGIVHLTRQNDWLTSFYRDDTNELWTGDFFKIKIAADKNKAVKIADGMITQHAKISLSAEDRV